MAEIGIRELKARASEIVRAVREHRARYTITYRGRPVGVLLPLDEATQAEALAVREGNILAVGSWEDVEPHAEGVPVLDLAGKTVVPVLIDTHTHFLWTALSLAALDVSAADDHAALQRIIREAVVVDGRVIGTWRKAHKKNRLEVAVELFEPVGNPVRALIEEEGQDIGRFSGQAARVAIEGLKTDR